MVCFTAILTEAALLKMTPDVPVSSRASAARDPSPGPFLHLQACGTVAQKQTVLPFHCKHMVKLKCVISLGLRVAQQQCLRTHTHTHWRGVTYLGPTGGPASRRACHTHRRLKGRSLSLAESESETHFLRSAHQRGRNDALTGMLQINTLDGWMR